jgi:Uncharacterized protein conserved in bacteria (DUF2325)
LSLSNFPANKPARLKSIPSAWVSARAYANVDSCEPGVGEKVVALHLRQRLKLWQLPRYLHCSVIGTCLGVNELRKLVLRCGGNQFAHVSELEIHEEGVRLAGQDDAGGRMLHKALDQRYLATVRRFDKVKTATELIALWEEAKNCGEIPGAYWAVMTHRMVTPELCQRAFGDVHMLSHLVGAANRADIRRLTQLEAQNRELVEKVEKQQTQLRDVIVGREDTIKRLEQQLAARIAHTQSARDAEPAGESDERHTLRDLVTSLQRQLAHHVARSERAQMRTQELTLALTEVQAQLRGTRDFECALRSELEAAETQLLALHATDGEDDTALHRAVQNRKIVYVGGRPGAIHAMRALVERSHGEFFHHDGGLEERIGLLASAIAKADLVLFPVDCVSHDAAGQLKRLCRQAGRTYCPLRSASVASFVAALVADAAPVVVPEPIKQNATPCSPLSRFCLRHG